MYVVVCIPDEGEIEDSYGPFDTMTEAADWLAGDESGICPNDHVTVYVTKP